MPNFYPGQGDYLAQLNAVAAITNVYLLGAKSANPTVDNNGDPLVISAMYWNTVTLELRMWTGAIWTAIPTGSYSQAADKDASGGYAGLTGFAINLWNAAKTFKSSLTFNGTANRVHTFPDKDITVAGLVDITGTNSGVNTGDETLATIKTKLSIATLSGSNTGDQTAATVGNTPAGNIASTTVQAALNELDTEKAALSGAIFTGDIKVPSINGGGQLAGLRNRIINGNFWINHRNVSGTVTLAAGAYGHDRWKAGAGGCTYTFSTTLNITTITISAGTLMQVIEGANLQSGAHILSWAGTAQGRVDTGAYGVTGVAGTAVGGTNQTIEFNTGTLGLVMYERGSVATSFENRYALELALCRRFTRPVPRNVGQSIAAYESIHYFETSDMRAAVSINNTSGWTTLTAAGGSTAATLALGGAINGDTQIITTTTGLVAGNAVILIPPAGALFVAEL